MCWTLPVLSDIMKHVFIIIKYSWICFLSLGVEAVLSYVQVVDILFLKGCIGIVFSKQSWNSHNTSGAKLSWRAEKVSLNIHGTISRRGGWQWRSLNFKIRYISCVGILILTSILYLMAINNILPTYEVRKKH